MTPFSFDKYLLKYVEEIGNILLEHDHDSIVGMPFDLH